MGEGGAWAVLVRVASFQNSSDLSSFLSRFTILFFGIKTKTKKLPTLKIIKN